VAGLADPVVDPEPQAAHPLGHGRAAGADDQAEVGQHRRHPLQVVPALVAEQRRVDQQRVQLHRDEVAGGNGAGVLVQLPASGPGALGEHGDEAAVVVDDRETGDGSIVCTQKG
jgi:hypothetical protein